MLPSEWVVPWVVGQDVPELRKDVCNGVNWRLQGWQSAMLGKELHSVTDSGAIGAWHATCEVSVVVRCLTNEKSICASV